MFSKQFFHKRREQVFNIMCDQSIAIIPTNAEMMRNGNDHYFPFRPHSDFYYLTGFAEPEAIAVLIKQAHKCHYILFNRVRDALMETWEGKRAGQEGAVQEYGADEARPYTQFYTDLANLIQEVNVIYYPFGFDPRLDHLIKEATLKAKKQVRAGVNGPDTLINSQTLIHPLRAIKQPEEIACMRQAGKIAAHAHRRAMQKVKPGLYEYQLEAEIIYEFALQGSRSPAYSSIVAGGSNACVLHYVENNQVFKAGELVLVDAGCEYQYFASDITRTYPVDGQWTAAQQAAYETVLAVQIECVQRVRSGVSFGALQDYTIQALTQGLVDLKILQGDIAGLIESKAYLPYYMHRVSHWLGMDTHDMGHYKENGEWCKLAPNMVLTIEPGLYFTPNKNLDEKWWNIGIRIEDDVVVTTGDPEVLTTAAPKTLADIKAAQQNH